MGESSFLKNYTTNNEILEMSEGLFILCLLTEIFQDDPRKFHNRVKGILFILKLLINILSITDVFHCYVHSWIKMDNTGYLNLGCLPFIYSFNKHWIFF